MALITNNGFEICNRNDYDLFFDNIVNGEVKNNFNDNEIKDIIEEWTELVIENDDMWRIYWNLLKQVINEYSNDKD